jgi:hypothetical protein
MIGMNGHHHARTPSCFAVADRLPYPNAIQLRARSGLRQGESVHTPSAGAMRSSLTLKWGLRTTGVPTEQDRSVQCRRSASAGAASQGWSGPRR